MKITEQILPLSHELPADYAERLGLFYSDSVSQIQKKKKGQFLTHSAIARFMGRMARSVKYNLSILDPGCGTGILSCAVIENLVITNPHLKSINLDVYEIDSEILPFTISSLDFLKEWLIHKTISFQYHLYNEDFILKNAFILNNNSSLFNNSEISEYDIVISNPPYFKLNKEDIRSKATEFIASGQQNIYSLFMAVASKMLNTQGQLIFITPRSYASGSYFKSFREFFFRNVAINQIHLFNSRKDTFNRDSVLQETIILKATRRKNLDQDSPVEITSTRGINDLPNPKVKTYPEKQIINLNSREKILHIPVNDEEEIINDIFQSWEGSLNKYNIQISTGPVVAFRAPDYIKEAHENGTTSLAPLIWLHNVNKMQLIWPVPKPRKGQYIQVCERSKALLIPNKDYILLRRFSSKDDKSRLIAAPYYADSNESEFIGIENKVNYIYRPKGILEKEEIIGIAALLNSKLFDDYFRIFNGNINVSATELREMPLPPLELIKKIGKKIYSTYIYNNFSQDTINHLVNQILIEKIEL